MTFSPDGRRLVFAAGWAATLWDLETGRRLETWSFPPGLGDILAFRPSGELNYFRVETNPPDPGPFRGVSHEQFPRVGRVRELLPSGGMRTIAEITRFNRHYDFVAAPDDLSYLVAYGAIADAAGTRRSVVSFDGDTWRPIWSVNQPPTERDGYVFHDPDRRVLGVQFRRTGPVDLYRMPDGAPLGTVQEWRQPVPGGRLIVAQRSVTNPDRAVLDVLRPRDGHRLLTLGAETLSGDGQRYQFSPDGRTLAWTRGDGSIAVAELSDLNARLTPLGLGWAEAD